MERGFRGFTHVERLGKPEVEGILNGTVYLFSKLDGSNGCIWADEDGTIHCGSRTREISVAKDNAGFADYMTNSHVDNLDQLRQFCIENPHLIIYGEWLGGQGTGRKFLGSIKRYINGGFFVFAVYNRETGKYLDYETYFSTLGKVYDKIIPYIAVMTNPTIDQLEEYVDKCSYNLADTDNLGGEGITIYNYDYTYYGRPAIAKIVRDEFKNEMKGKKPAPTNNENSELAFVENYITEAFMDKCRNKVMLNLEIPEWDSKNGKAIGMFLNLLVYDSMNEELAGFVRANKYSVTIRFNFLKTLIFTKGRKFLGLG